MRLPTRAVFLVACVAALASTALAGAAAIGIYRNSMGSPGQRGQVTKLLGERCERGGSSQAFRVRVGKGTPECAYRTPVIGRDLEIAATARLLSGTPKSVRSKAFLALDLRAGMAGAHYQLAVFPLQRKAQLRKTLSGGGIEYLKIAKDVASVKGINRANELRLRAFNITSGPEKSSTHLRAFVGPKRIAEVVDDAAGDLQGRASGFSVGAKGGAKGATASFDDVVVRVPDPSE